MQHGSSRGIKTDDAAPEGFKLKLEASTQANRVLHERATRGGIGTDGMVLGKEVLKPLGLAYGFVVTIRVLGWGLQCVLPPVVIHRFSVAAV